MFNIINSYLFKSGTFIMSIKMYILIYMCIVCSLSFINQTTATSCSAVQHIFISRGLNPNEIPNELKNDVILKYCNVPTTGTCCTSNMETKLAATAKMNLEKNIKDSIGKLASILGTRAQKFNDFFKDLLAESKREFHSMFKKTYGIIYEQNAYVFSELFAELERYYSTGNVDLTETLDSFFNTLYQKMFTVLNSQYKFDDKYLGCVGEHMKELKPFGDVPDKLSVQIKRSFVATRAFAQALNKAADVVKTVMVIRPTQNCTAALTKMHQCNYCSGYNVKPCANYCANVIKGCLSSYNELDIEWDNFVAAMEKVAERLLGPFNIVVVVEPINIKISEAIMNFQESGQDISQQVFHGCGKPILGRERRDTNSSFIIIQNDTNSDIKNLLKRSANPTNREIETYEPIQFTNTDDYNSNKGRRKNKNKKQHHNDNINQDNEEEYLNKEPVIDKLVKDIRQKVRDSKKIWSNLPYQICNTDDLAALPSTKESCWNGHTVDKYLHPVVTGSQINPEMPLSPTFIKTKLVENKLYTLRTIVNHLKNACNGQDVEWRDLEDTLEFGSGSGSGEPDESNIDGSGDSPIIVETTTTIIQESSTTIEKDNYQPKSEATPQMSKSRALFTYTFPIVMAWFGGMFSELL